MCGVGAKSVAHLMKFYLLQKRDPKVQQDFIGQGHYGKVKGQIKVTP